MPARRPFPYSKAFLEDPYRKKLPGGVQMRLRQ